MVDILKNYVLHLLMQLYASRNIHFLCRIIFLDFLLEELREFPASLEIGLKRVKNDHTQGHVIRESCTHGSPRTICQFSPFIAPVCKSSQNFSS